MPPENKPAEGRTTILLPMQVDLARADRLAQWVAALFWHVYFRAICRRLNHRACLADGAARPSQRCSGVIGSSTTRRIGRRTHSGSARLGAPPVQRLNAWLRALVSQ